MNEPSFCVYLHKRPDGTVFYVGKGIPSRAYDFAPSRRNKHHRNIVAKHGRANIGVEVLPCRSEAQAFGIEQILITAHRWEGLANQTAGGEGCAGRRPTEKQLAALARGRETGKAKPKSLENVRLGHEKAGEKRRIYLKTAKGREHVRKMVDARIANMRPSQYACAACGVSFASLSRRAKCCSKACQQRHRRANGGR